MDSGTLSVSALEDAHGSVIVSELADGRRRIEVRPAPGAFVSRSDCVTSYPPELIEEILRAKSAAYLCDEITRDEDPNYVGLFLRYGLLSYVPADRFAGARILDFGSGSGASTVILARMFPSAQIVGVELEPALISIARHRARHYGLTNVRFLESPDPNSLPADLGTFGFVNLGAVYEHLLPAERPRLMSTLWGLLEPGGVMFVNQLPFRYYPMEAHTTGLPLLNYLPDGLVHRLATRYSGRIDPQASWARLLRDGIRGGTARSVKRDLESGGGVAEPLRPDAMGLRDHAELWYRYSSQVRPHPVKRAMLVAFRAASALTRQPFAPSLTLAFRKLA